MPDIIFKFEGKTYKVSYEACIRDRILLPDGRVLRASKGWFNTNSAYPEGLVTTDETLSPEEAKLVLAVEIK